MKRKIFNGFITILAIIGFFVIIGGVGTMDYMATIGEHYPLIETLKTMMVGFLFVLPAVVREVR